MEVTVKDLSGTPAQRLEDLAAADGESNEWLRAQLQLTLHELAAIQPFADNDIERAEDF